MSRNGDVQGAKGAGLVQTIPAVEAVGTAGGVMGIAGRGAAEHADEETLILAGASRAGGGKGRVRQTSDVIHWRAEALGSLAKVNRSPLANSRDQPGGDHR